MRECRLYIGGQYVAPHGAETFDSTNPATGEIVGRFASADKQDIERAVEAAQAGIGTWQAMGGSARGRIMMKAADLLRECNRELAELEVRDTGKPISEAEAVDVLSGADCFEYFAGLASKIEGAHGDLSGGPGSQGGAFYYTRREPLGICAGIGAWNYPLQIACWKAAPALACGNAMIFKPSELAPLSAFKLAEILSEAGLPAGVFNIVTGFEETGRQMIEHPAVAKVSLTGSVATGKKVMAASAQTLKQITLELGGKSPLIIFDDADLDNAVSAALMANFYTQGEICSNGTRVFIQNHIHDEFLDRLIRRTKKIIVGDPMHPETQMGSLISRAHMDKVLAYIETGKAEGANLVCGGSRVRPEGLDGYFVEPTIFDDCRDDMTIVREEIFGPVMAVLSFEDEADVLERANDSIYGLAAGIFTADLGRAHRMAAKLEAGICWINNYNITPIEVPFGGVRQSGLGRENGLAAIEYYTRLKSVYVELGDVEAPF